MFFAFFGLSQLYDSLVANSIELLGLYCGVAVLSHVFSIFGLSEVNHVIG